MAEEGDVARAGVVDRRKLLESISLFEGLSPRDYDALMAITATKHLRAKEILFRKGDTGRQLYGVMRGRLRVSTAGEDGKEVVFRFHDPGEILGEIALIDSHPRSATIEAVEDSELLTIDRRDLLPLLERNPQVSINLSRVLAERVRRLSELMEDRLFLGLSSRLAKKLLSLASSYGRPVDAGVLIDLRLPQHELGELVGASRESVNKQLRSWVEDELVTFDHGYITILDVEGLESLAHLLSL